MSDKLRVLLADDSITVRRILSDALSADGELEVCAAARDGQEALTKYTQIKPDVVILDVEMPVMDGIEAVIGIRKLDPRVPIIMFSSLTMKGGQATLDALSHGAADYVTKPSRSGSTQEAIAHIQEQLIPKVKQLGRRHRNAHSLVRSTGGLSLLRGAATNVPAVHATQLPNFAIDAGKFDVVTVGVSTGGPNALADMLKKLPKNFSTPILIAQHMPALFTQLLAERLSQVCSLNVREAIEGAVVEPGQVWIAPGGQHMVVDRHGSSFVLHLNHDRAENSCRPSVDVLFRGVADAYRHRVLAVVLTGMGCDGKKGCQKIRENGGKIIVQDEATSVVWGMPGAVANAGLADCVLPLPEIANHLSRLSPFARSMTIAGH